MFFQVVKRMVVRKNPLNLGGDPGMFFLSLSSTLTDRVPRE